MKKFVSVIVLYSVLASSDVLALSEPDGLPRENAEVGDRKAGAASETPMDVKAALTRTAARLTFTDITLSAGTGGPQGKRNTGGHAAIFADVDDDGRPDLYYTMLFKKDMPDLFFRNRSGRDFKSEAAVRGIDDFDGGSHGATFADLDNDGDYDLFNGTTYGTPSVSGRNNIFQNDGDGFFTEVTSPSGPPDREWPTRGVIAFDMDSDGYLDLFCVTNYEGSNDPPGERNEVYRNNGGLRFSSITFGTLYTAPVGQGASDTDFDGDGDVDVIAGNRSGDVNILRNDGLGNFSRVSPSALGITHRAGDGATTADVDNDGDLDILLADAPDGHLYRRDGNGKYSFVRSFFDIDGYMGGFADLDNDGDLDLVFAGNTECFLNDGRGQFTAGPAIPVRGIKDPRAVAFADIDDDGDVDFAFGAKRSRNWLVRNNLDSGNWLKVKLISPGGQAGAFGAKTRIYPAGQAGGQQLGMRESRSNNGYLGQDDPVVHFGLGNHSAVDLVVRFLDGKTVTRRRVTANQTVTVDATISSPRLPTISAFTPISGPVGTELTLTGSNLTGTTDVLFNVAADFEVDSDSQVRAKVPPAAVTGSITVKSPGGTARSLAEFKVTPSGNTVTFVAAEDTYVRSNKRTRNYGDRDEMAVRRNSSAKQVAYMKFDVTGLSGLPQSARLRLVISDPGIEAGSVYLVSNDYENSNTPWTEEGLIWSNAPAIPAASLSSVGRVQESEIAEFDVSTAISGNGVFSFALKNSSSDAVKFYSKEGAKPPQLLVGLDSGETRPLLPTILTLSPPSGPVGTEVSISGANFAEARAVTFGGIASTTFFVDSDSSIRAWVPQGGQTGKVGVTTLGGLAVSHGDFIVEPASLPTPVVSSFSPTTGSIGTEVTITGKQFAGATSVTFNGIVAPSFVIVSDERIKARVPAGATTGKIRITNSAGSGVSQDDFAVTTGSGGDTFAFQPAGDAFAWSKKPSRNYGGAIDLRVRNTKSAQQVAYLKFDVSGLVGVVATAKVRLFVTDGSKDGCSIYLVANEYVGTVVPWEESGLQASNAPEVTGIALGSAGRLNPNQSVELDVSEVVAGDGVFSFAIKNRSADVLKLSSKEGVAAPELVIETIAASNRIARADLDGPQSDLATVTGWPGAALGIELMPNYPNPFNHETTISYRLSSPADVHLQIFNIRGREVRQLLDAFRPPGLHQVSWDGRDNYGNVVSSGTYISLLRVDRQKISRRIVLQK